MQRSSASVFLAALTSLCALVALSGCSEKKQAAPAAPQVFVAKPIQRTVELWDKFSGDVKPIEAVDVRARVGGYLESVNFTEGQNVAEGDLLFVIDPRPYKAVVDAAEASVLSVKARIALAESNLARAKELHAANAVSKEVLDTRQSEKLAADAALLDAQARLREAKLNLEFTQVRAPISGMVSKRLVDRGNIVNANTTLLTTIVRKDIVQIEFEISERDLVVYHKSGLFDRVDQKNRKGPSVVVTLPQDPEARYNGVLTYFDNRLGKETASLTLRADLDNRDGRLLPGQNAYVNLLGGVRENALLVPEVCIGTDLVNRYVVVVDDKNVVQYRPVKVGRLLGKLRVVESGLKPDDCVVIVGLTRAIPGRVVAPENGKIEE